MNYPEPFRSELVVGPFAYNGDLRSFEGSGEHVVRVEQYHGQDISDHKQALERFEELSGLNVVPYSDVIGETDPPEDLVGVSYSDDSRFQAVFHVAKFVTSEIVSHNASELDFPPEVAAELISGLTSYYISTFESGEPYSYEIRPCQFMYGKIGDEQSPQLYMVDVDYALSESASVDDLLWNFGFNVDFLRDYAPNKLLRQSAETMLCYLKNPEIEAWSRGSDYRRDTLENIRSDLLDYIDQVDHI